MRLLELFSGTGSVGEVFRERGWEVISLDRDLPADIRCDIMDWDYRDAYPPGFFDFISASPPCTERRSADINRISTVVDIMALHDAFDNAANNSEVGPVGAPSGNGNENGSGGGKQAKKMAKSSHI